MKECNGKHTINVIISPENPLTASLVVGTFDSYIRRILQIRSVTTMFFYAAMRQLPIVALVTSGNIDII